MRAAAPTSNNREQLEKSIALYIVARDVSNGRLDETIALLVYTIMVACGEAANPVGVIASTIETLKMAIATMPQDLSERGAS